MRLTMGTALLCLLGGTAAPAQRLQPPLGSQASFTLTGERNLKGELLAVDQDSIWLFQGQRVLSVPRSEIAHVQVDRGGMGAKDAMLWSAIGGLVTGFALKAACESVDHSDDAISGGATNCGAVFAGTLSLWLLVGAVSSVSLNGTRHPSIATEPDTLRAYARFPQGLPAAFPRDSLVHK